jgi:isopenicillin N synthase-like dioxygenase
VTTALPVVDLAAPGRDDVDDALEHGAFYLARHGVAPPLIDDHFALTEAFFALDSDEKCAIDVRRSNAFRGYEPFGTQTIDAATPGDLKEGFIMGPDLDPAHPYVVAGFPNTGSNQWPRRPRGLRAHMERYVVAMNAVGRRVASLLATALDLSATYFDELLAEPLTYAQLFHYPPMPEAPPAGSLGAGAHTDWGMLTILLQNGVAGLECRSSGAGWRSVPPLPGTLVVVFGEMLLRLTNGRVAPALHRVVANVSGRSRYSMPTFVDPPYDARIGCVPTCLPAHGPPTYPACTVAEHMRAMAAGTLSESAFEAHATISL